MTTTATGGGATETNNLKLFALTWPIFLELLLFMLMGTVDTFMLSAVSDEAVSAVGTANQIVIIAILILEVIGNGAAIVVAQYIGSRKLAEASRVSAIAITLNLCVGLAISILFVFGGRSILQAMNLSGELLALGQAYLTIVGGGIFLQALINILAAIIRTYGYTKQTMLVSLVMNVIHLVGNYALIFGHFGFSPLGVQGAAISTVFSRLICVVIFFWLLYRVLSVRIEWKHYFTISRNYVGKILKIGIPSAFEQIIYQVCQLVFLYYVTYLGTESLATRQYAAQISHYIYLFSMAVSIGTSILVGRFVGAGNPEEAYARLRKSVKIGLTSTIIMDLIIIALREPLLGIFTDSAEIIRLGSQVILFSIVLETARTCNMIMINSLRAAGDARFPVYMGLISMVGISLPLGYVLVFTLDMGLLGVWMANAVDEWIRAIIMHFRWKSGAWRKHALVEHSPIQEQAQPASTHS
ncbi:MATE family efflux transporter [Paenibacillus provencensis]|uniref:MATE family efflux transporter n=1 Tax=Paenibacillus provencensis TaxID=441151 RepID=A0ABW3PXX7_9BACL|nr:MATE family efflux transporter [Paenibacillus sp. MER 78]MCM3128553.1 MATE family efflux transporter [Paenibacillus sp. MER 78]